MADEDESTTGIGAHRIKEGTEDVTEVLASLSGQMMMQYFDDGDTVEEGDPIAEIECMKVFNRILAPCKGVIINMCALGEYTEPETVVAEIAPPDPGSVDLSRVN